MDSKTIIDAISNDSSVNRDDIQSIINSFSQVLAERIIDLDVIVIPGFGQFEGRKRNERLTVHPASGERLMVPPKLVLNFRPSGVLKNKIK